MITIKYIDENFGTDFCELVVPELSGLNWSGRSFHRASFEGLALTEMRLCRARLGNTFFLRSVLTQCDLDGALLANAVFIDCEIRDCTFKAAQIIGAVFERCRFSQVDLREAVIEGCSFEACVIVECTFSDGQIMANELDMS